ncbi:helix-turn-helix domain-containing protein [Shimia sp.]|uniref:helix-turn-helix domain-containing protein n=1 Tax=Shimia sp. TaxID=1954381 RepID=UPI0032988EA6
MGPSDRLLQVMEYLMAAGPEPVKQVDISRDLGISAATVNRIVRTLAKRGYLFHTSEKYCIPNFRLIRNVPMSESYLSVLSDLMNDITAEHSVSVEAVVVTGFDLLWHSRTQLPDASVAIRAARGFRRSLYELDAMSRLYLSRLGWDEVSYKYFTGGFFKTGLEMKGLAPSEARRIIEDVAEANFDMDFDGNHVGVRRFSTIIEDEEGKFLHLLSIAEAAVPVRDKQEHVAKARRVLSEARATLNAQIKAEAVGGDGISKHYANLKLVK